MLFRSPEWLATLYNSKQTIFSSKAANEVLHWSPAVGYDAALAETLAWLASAGYLPESVNDAGVSVVSPRPHEYAVVANGK